MLLPLQHLLIRRIDSPMKREQRVCIVGVNPGCRRLRDQSCSRLRKAATVFTYEREYGVFGPDLLQALGDAFDATCAALTARGNVPFVREVIAQRIIGLARRGERDPERLCHLLIGEPTALGTLH